MKTVSVCGHFGFGREFLDGQTVKTKIIYDELVRALGEDKVCALDTYGGKKALVRLAFGMLKAVKSCRNVVILPAQNGIRVIPPLLMTMNVCFRRKLHYVVIGGWLDSFLENRKALVWCLKRFDCIYVETSTMKTALESRGFENVVVMPNCKRLRRLTEDELVYAKDEPYKLCTFSRVMREKGIETAVEAVKEVNSKLGRAAYTLDIYGQVDSGQTEWFAELKQLFPDYIRYSGAVPAEQSVEVMKDYFALLFPTFYEGEGFAGTLLDAFSSGVPVIASDWKYNSEIVEDGVVGFLVPPQDSRALCDCLGTMLADRKLCDGMKQNCLEKAKEYDPQNVIQVLISKMI